MLAAAESVCSGSNTIEGARRGRTARVAQQHSEQEEIRAGEGGRGRGGAGGASGVIQSVRCGQGEMNGRGRNGGRHLSPVSTEGWRAGDS
jgi:hypothetical protein